MPHRRKPVRPNKIQNLIELARSYGGHGVVDSGCDPHILLPAKNLVHIQTLGGPRSVVAVVK